MTLALRYAVRSDVGLLREGNEDSAYAGPRLLAVADGMGGHAAGEVASAVAISALAALDERPARERPARRARRRGRRGQPHAARHGRRRPVDRGHGHHAHRHALVRRPGWRCATSATPAPTCCATASSTRSPTTTPWSSRWSTRAGSAPRRPPPTRSARCSCGRSTAAATSSRTCRCARPRSGDRYLLCSDGLSGVVSEQTLHQTLATVADLDDVVRQLIELAIRRRRPGQHHLHRRRRGGQRDRGPAAQRGVGAGGRRHQRQRAACAALREPGRPATVLTQTAPQAAIVIAHDDPVPRAAGGAALVDEAEPEDHARRRLPIVKSLVALLLIVDHRRRLRGMALHPDAVLRGRGRRARRHLPWGQPERGRAEACPASTSGPRSRWPRCRSPTRRRSAPRSAPPAWPAPRPSWRTIRGEYQKCQAAHQSLQVFEQKQSAYTKALDAYKKKHHQTTAAPVRNKAGKVVATPPAKPAGTQPTIPPDCPAPSAAAGTGTAP